jgi:hypothetical protein
VPLYAGMYFSASSILRVRNFSISKILESRLPTHQEVGLPVYTGTNSPPATHAALHYTDKGTRDTACCRKTLNTRSIFGTTYVVSVWSPDILIEDTPWLTSVFIKQMSLVYLEIYTQPQDETIKILG